MENDSRVLRGRHEDLEDELDRIDMTPPDAGKALLVQTVNGGHYPTTAASYFLVVSVEAAGDEQEGSVPSFSADSSDSAFPCLNLGSQVPPQGTYLIARLIGGRWTMRYDG